MNMKKWIKISIGLGLVLLIILAGFFVISYKVMLEPIPNYSGQVKVEGIEKDVKIYRDKYGVPFIETESEEDAAFALGFVHAQERMFQMDLIRRAAEGRLAEVMGRKVLPFDLMFRTVGLKSNIVKNYEKLNPKTRIMLTAYSNGVNAYLKSNDTYSFEFDLLGYSPEEWKPIHSLLVAKLMAWELNISWWTDIAFSHLIQKFGPEKVSEILPGFDENAPTIIPKGFNVAEIIDMDFIKTDRKFREFIGMGGTHIGSNNWVVNSRKSESGKVIIANDPHLAFSVPGKWYLAVIKAADWNAEGFTIPGVPAIVIGKNKNISWALTNVMTDDADFYLEKFDSSKTKYFFNNEWKTLSIVKDTIKVKDSSDVVLQIQSTHRGPIVSGIHPYNVLFPNNEQNKANISMRWTASELSDEYFAMYKINKSRNWSEFAEAVRNFTVPGQNFVYGDKDDNIGYICAARLPIRNSSSPTLIYDGTTEANDWKGFVPYEDMPKLFNPSQNFIASANNKTVAHFPYHISNIWEPASRITRINEVLTGKNLLSVSDYKKLQNDFYSHYAKMVVPRIFTAFEKTNIGDANLKTALQLLSQWDNVMNKDSQAPSIYLTFYDKLLRNLFVDEMGENLFLEYVFIANVPYRIIEEIFAGKNISWIDDIRTKKIETLDEIIRKSFVEALELLEITYGKKIENWQWLNLHTVTFKHPFSGASIFIDKLINIGPFDISGDGTTVFNTEYSFTSPYEVKLGPSMRYIYDFSDPNKFYYVMPTGQSGHIMSDHYDDMTKMWLNGKYIELDVEPDFSDPSAFQLLILKNK
ncbi:MAG: penicillin acylase family protein [Ignavibacteriae bacterium HGW-Ignavibacteriae-2]|jgi:penicillin amidase|nr:MAG: penicillin acylase family protein [Ignavibacteriae bacterium HGW-Ignavibacteriae-2]